MNTVYSILQSLNSKLGEVASQMDTGSWIALSVVTVVGGWMMLRGNVLKST